MPVNWEFSATIELGGISGKTRIPEKDAQRQTRTAREILHRLKKQPGVILADEVGMGKTFVAMAVIASVLESERHNLSAPVVVMVPPGILTKWLRDWQQFKTLCVHNNALAWVQERVVQKSVEFLHVLDEERKAHLVFMPQTCFTRNLDDPWFKLAMIRLARSTTRLDHQEKNRLLRWAATLVRQSSRLDEDLIEKLLRHDLENWRQLLLRSGKFRQFADKNPIPEGLVRYANRIDWSELAQFLHELPGKRPTAVNADSKQRLQKQFNTVIQKTYRKMLSQLAWLSPLLVLDEAHHSKNDNTHLARLFRPESEESVALLEKRFRRMLFLTATPFQLGHHELIRVLRSFAAVPWGSSKAPEGGVEQFHEKMDELEKALDDYRIAARRFDRQWGKIPPEVVRNLENETEEKILSWWQNWQQNPVEVWQKNLVEIYKRLCDTKSEAQQHLRPWIIRHNKPPFLPNSQIPRRQYLAGDITRENGDTTGNAIGIPIAKEALLPFLITARTMGELEQAKGMQAYFAGGLASSYEAFHHTRDEKNKASENTSDIEPKNSESPWHVPMSWYERQISEYIPSRKADRMERLKHPKVKATVERALELWKQGEKVLIFCFYIQTVRALRDQLQQLIEEAILDMAGKKLGLDPKKNQKDIEHWLTRIRNRLSDKDSPFYKEVEKLLELELKQAEFQILEKNQQYRARILKLLHSYFNTPAFIVRYLPLEDQEVRLSLEYKETRHEIIQRGVAALEKAIHRERDSSGQSYRDKIREFLRFSAELAEHAQFTDSMAEKEDRETPNPLLEYLEAAGGHTLSDLVRSVDGATDQDTRNRLVLSFNSPLFPEILIASAIFGEGIDLHRFCRYVIHHDLDWNPSVIEQRTGRLDRVNSKAEVSRKPIEIAEPFLAGSADEKRYRVVKDRERWFSVVMGQEFRFDESESSQIAARLPLPKALADRLVFSLALDGTEQTT
ncbi:MAG: helicase-related protein [Turneriella sp.]|nr:helicase-related protein [Turneriella sp.]